MDTPDTDTTAPAAPARSSTAPIEVHAKELGMPDWELAALKAFHRWPIGKVVSSTDFDNALKTLRTERFGY